MVTITCDKCGKRIPTASDRVYINFDCFEPIIFNGQRDYDGERKELCINCAKQVLEFIEHTEDKKNG